MHLMPLLMVLPLLALPIFWLLPLAEALPIYACLFAVWLAMVRIMRKTMKFPAKTGTEHLTGREAVIVSKSEGEYGAQYIARLEGELWSAESADILRPGEKGIVTSVRGNKLIVTKS